MLRPARKLQTEDAVVRAPPVANTGDLLPFVRRQDADTTRIIALVAKARRVPAALLVQRSRRKDVALARQLAMYLMNVALRRSLTATGRCFGRDRTTVAYACKQIEELREEEKFDAEVAALEAALSVRAGEEAVRASR